MRVRLLSVLMGCAFACGATLAPPLVAQISQPPINRLVVGGPPPPVHAGSVSDHTLTDANVRFRWLAGTGQTTPVRYEICVREPNQPCNGPGAAIYRPSGVLLTEPLPTTPVLRTDPRDPNFKRPMGGAGVAPYFLNVVLPLQFQGKRLQWSINACVPNTRVAYASAAAPPELCTTSGPRNLAFALPLPVLRTPALGSMLANLTPEFSWDATDPQGIEYFLVCVSTGGATCPVAPGLQPFVFVARVENAPQIPRTYTPGARTFAALMGESLQWTVAACNAALGCAYQPARGSFRVPIMEGTFDSIYEVTQNAKCKNCHQMFNENDTYKRHINLGRFTRNDDFKISSGCAACHTAATGFANGWSAPDSFASFDKPRGGLCSVFRFDREAALSAATGFPHVADDPLIHWAVDQIPGLGYDAWRWRFYKWDQAKRPCSDEPHGQFSN